MVKKQDKPKGKRRFDEFMAMETLERAIAQRADIQDALDALFSVMETSAEAKARLYGEEA